MKPLGPSPYTPAPVPWPTRREQILLIARNSAHSSPREPRRSSSLRRWGLVLEALMYFLAGTIGGMGLMFAALTLGGLLP